MSSHPVELNLEPVIWARLIAAQSGDIPAEVARCLLDISFREADCERMRYLADQPTAGILTADERAELDGYLHIGNLVAVMQSKARVALGEKPRAVQAS